MNRLVNELEVEHTLWGACEERRMSSLEGSELTDMFTLHKAGRLIMIGGSPVSAVYSQDIFNNHNTYGEWELSITNLLVFEDMMREEGEEGKLMYRLFDDAVCSYIVIYVDGTRDVDGLVTQLLDK